MFIIFLIAAGGAPPSSTSINQQNSKLPGGLITKKTQPLGYEKVRLPGQMAPQMGGMMGSAQSQMPPGNMDPGIPGNNPGMYYIPTFGLDYL